MPPSLHRALGLIAHELAGPLAEMGSEADLLALSSIKELEIAYGPGAEYDRARERILAYRENLRQAHHRAEASLRLAVLAAQDAPAWSHLHLRPVSTKALVTEALASSRLAGTSIAFAGNSINEQTVCDKDLMMIALRNLLNACSNSCWRSASAEIVVNRENSEVVVTVACSPAASPPDTGDIGLVIASAVVSRHSGSLRINTTVPARAELRWCSELAPGDRSVELASP